MLKNKVNIFKEKIFLYKIIKIKNKLKKLI